MAEVGSETTHVFTSKVPWDDAYSDVVVVACSDGRVVRTTDEFLQTLGITHPDRLFIPGGLAAMIGATGGINPDLQKLIFLVKGHGTKRLIAMAHDHCGHYRDRFPLHDHDGLCRLQVDELREFKQLIGRVLPEVEVLLYSMGCQGARAVVRQVD